MGRDLAGWVMACILLAARGCAEKKPAPGQKAAPAVGDYAVSIPDVNFAAVVEKAIGKSSGELRRSELAGLATLDARGREIISIAGIEHFPALSRLHLSGNYIRDITPLTGMTRFNYVDLSNNRLTDIGPPRNLHNAGGLGPGSFVNVERNSLGSQSVLNHIPVLNSDGAEVRY